MICFYSFLYNLKYTFNTTFYKNQEQIIKLESQVTERTEELDRIKNDLKENNIIVNDQAKIIESISKENDYLKNLVQKLANEKVCVKI